VPHRGCSLPLQRVITDLGADLPFAQAAGKLQEHYGVILSPSTIRQVTEGHARALIVDGDAEPAWPTQTGAATVIAEVDGGMVPLVEVDPDTGQVTVLRHVACDDAGTLVNPMIVDGQAHGGIASGIAQALMEEFVYDEDGNPNTANFADYGLVSAAELPSFERIEQETPTPRNPLGAKGIGESGTIGSTPAVQNAVIDAVAHLGVKHIDMPLRAERVWRALRQHPSRREE